jgi:uncharacterized protein
MKKMKSMPFLLFLVLNVFFAGACSSKSADYENKEVDIHTAIVENNIEAVKKYIAAKKNLNEKDPMGGSSPLITAALFGRTEIAKLLIDAGADLTIQNNDGSTALHVAAFFCHPEIVKMLLKKGANKSVKNKYGSTAYESVSIPYKEVKNIYQGIEQMLSPIGLKLDYAYIEKNRPIVAALLK